MYFEEEITDRLKLLMWDTKISSGELVLLLKGERDQINGFTRKNLFAKILNGYNWHAVRKIIPENELKEALSDEVVNGLFPRTLREKYRYVRSLL